ncbi:uncharacterized protein [Periplaneta americana]|uniref:uncharacterized protein isoform X1 n=1 Tax=Periplaneta americana TaxID=6978 RepID=UPI0037E89FA9
MFDYDSATYKNSDRVEYDTAHQTPVGFENSSSCDICAPEPNTNGFKFKYVSEDKFLRIMKHVKRNKVKEKEEREWLEYLNRNKEEEPSFITHHNAAERMLEYDLSEEEQDELQDYYNNKLKEPERQVVWHDYLKEYEEILKDSALEPSKTTTHIHAERIEDKWDVDNDERVQQKANEKHMPTSKKNSDIKFLSDTGNEAPLEIIHEEHSSSNESDYSMLSDIEYNIPQSPMNKNRNYNSDIPNYSKEHCERNLYVEPLTIVPKLNLCEINKDVPKLNLCEINRDGIHSRRMRNSQKKIDVTLDGILKMLNNMPEPDGNQDLLRRLKRAAEFSARFSRNYLYQLRRQMCELKKLVRESATVARGRHTFYQVLYQKIAIAHQTTHLGLEAYFHHMPSSVKGAASEKLRDLLNLTIDLMKICNKLGVPPPEMTSAPQVIEKKVKIMITLITVPTTTISLDNFEDNLPTSRTVTASMMTTTGCRDWESCLRTAERKVPTTSSKDAYSVNSIPWRERATRLARAIYGSPLKKKNSTLKKVVGSKTIKKPTNALKSTLTESYKNMDTVKKSPAAPLPSPPFPASPLPERKATSKLHNMEEVKCGDNIRTAVESFPLDVQVQEEDPHQKRCTETKKCDSTSHLVEHISSKVLDRCAKELRNNFETYMTGIVDNIDEKQKSVQQSSDSLQLAEETEQEVKNTVPQEAEPTRSTNIRSNEKSKYTRIGSKNAQLIIIKSDDCMPVKNKEKHGNELHEACNADSTDTDEHHHFQSNMNQTKTLNFDKTLKKIHTRTVDSKKPVYHGYESQNNSKSLESSESAESEGDLHKKSYKNLTKKHPIPLYLPKKDLLSAVAYNEKFYDYKKYNPMYKDSTKPWITAGR